MNSRKEVINDLLAGDGYYKGLDLIPGWFDRYCGHDLEHLHPRQSDPLMHKYGIVILRCEICGEETMVSWKLCRHIWRLKEEAAKRRRQADLN